MSPYPSFSEDVAGLRYTLTFRPAPQGSVSVFLGLPGAEPEPWCLIHGEEAQPGEPDDAGVRWPAALPRLTREARANVLRAAELLADGEGGWALPLLPGMALDDVEVWVLQTLDRRRAFFQTGWMTCACGHIRQRLRRDADGYHLHAQAMALDWHDLARNVMLEALEHTKELALTRASGLEIPVVNTLSLPLVTAAQADPEVATLALEASTFERTFTTLAQALAAMQTERSELHEQVAEQWQHVGAVMKRHVPKALNGTPFERADLGPRLDDLDLDDEDSLAVNAGSVLGLELYFDVRKRPPRVLTFGDHAAAFKFVFLCRMHSDLPVPMLLADPDAPPVPWGDVSDGRVPAYLRDVVCLLTNHVETGEMTRWVARARPEWSAAQVLYWFWQEWQAGHDDFMALNPAFEYLNEIRLEEDRPIFRDAEGFHRYLLAQIEANGFRVVRTVVDGEPVYTAVLSEQSLPRRTPRVKPAPEA